MTEVRPLASSSSSCSSPSSGSSGLFATESYNVGDTILDESPLFVFRPVTPQQVHDVESQFRTQQPSASASVSGGGKSSSNKKKKKKKNRGGSGGVKFASPLPPSSSALDDIISPPPGTIDRTHAGKFRGMVVATATYAAQLIPAVSISSENELPLDHNDDAAAANAAAARAEQTRRRILALYAPNLNSPADDERSIVETARAAYKYCLSAAATRSALARLVSGVQGVQEVGVGSGEEEFMKVALVWSCNAFDGGEVYETISRVNHSCDPCCVVRESALAPTEAASAATTEAKTTGAIGEAGSGAGSSAVASPAPTGSAAAAAANQPPPPPRRQQLVATTPLKPGDEITISYLGIFLYASGSTRLERLRTTKHFTCRCTRCQTIDIAGAVPCPACCPRVNGRYLDEDVQYDDDKTVPYAYPKNADNDGRGVRCERCGEANTSSALVTLIAKVSDKVADRILTTTASTDDTEEGQADVEHEVDTQLAQLSSSILGARHWTTNLMTLSVLQRNLAAMHSASLLGESAPDVTDLAECIDSLQRLWDFCEKLGLKKSDPGHLLCGPTVGVARALVSLGDVKSKKYAAEWTGRVEQYVRTFESEGMGKVVDALLGAWKRAEDETMQDEQEDDGMEEEGEGSNKRARMSYRM